MILQIDEVGPAINRELKLTRYKDIDILLFFYENRNELKDVALFGGVIRDLFLFGEISKKSDFDFVVGCDKDVLRKIISDFNPQENKFGGFRFKFGERFVDIWSLSETWAIKNGFVENHHGMMDLLHTTFFNVDSAYYRVYDKSLICSKNFKIGIQNKKLDINLKNNPAPDKIIKRIEKMNKEKFLELNNAIKKYMLGNFD